MRRAVAILSGLAVILSAGAALAARPPVVVELFTAQGCSSSGPANASVADLAARDDVLALTFSVDYWDYLGWKDTFAQKAFTDRQRAYAKAVGSRTIYTPQLIIGGQDRIEGFSPDETADRLREHLALGSTVRLTVTRDGDQLVIRAEADPPLDAPVRVQLVRFKPEETVTIERGENAGKTVTYRNIVTSWEGLGSWEGQEPLEMSAPYQGQEPGAVIVQTAGPAAILAAVRVD